MSIVGDVLGVLDRIPIWKRLQQVPNEIEELRTRIAALEAALAKAPGESCKYCGERAMRLASQGRIMGSMGKQERTETWKCEKCGREDVRIARL
jgi:uncharacterized protein with PIN domain